MNVDDLLLCALPYHATPEFARLLVLLQLNDSVWAWLAPGQQSGAPPPRDALVRRCVNDQVRCTSGLGYLGVVCQHVAIVVIRAGLTVAYSKQRSMLPYLRRLSMLCRGARTGACL